MVMEIIKLELLSVKYKKALIEKYSGYDDTVSKIIVNDSRAAIRQSQQAIAYLSTLIK